ncbi:MAG: ATP-dependent DNA ligase, partial [Bacteroidota bacterium]
MKDIAQMFSQLDQTTKTNAKVQALADYFVKARNEDRLWTVAILSHRRPKRTVNTTLLRSWAAEFGKIEPWLFEQSYHI